MWVYGQTDLADFYAGRLSLRQLLNRFVALPPEAPIWHTLREEADAAEAVSREAEIEQTLAKFKPGR